jgi:CO/xanthine dehydrogenase Mo-binding subunit
VSSTLEQTKTWVGTALKRKEDIRFVRGRGEYVDDRRFPGALHVFPVRSPYAHANILSIDATAALQLPGVMDVVSGEELKGQIQPAYSQLPPPCDRIATYPLAMEKVRFSGEPVAVVVAESPYQAEDGALAVQVDYDPLEVLTDPEVAIKSTPIHASTPTNLVWSREMRYGDIEGAFAKADHIVRRSMHLHRFTSAPLETRAAVVEYNDRTGLYTIFSNLQNPERYRARIASCLGIAPRLLHFECPDIGGGFGIKLHMQWVILLCYLAKKYGRPVKWIEDRTGHLMASHHGNEVAYDAEMAFDQDGHILGLRARTLQDEGAYLEREPKGLVNQLRHFTGLYTFRNLAIDFLAVITNKCPTGPNRAYGKVQTSFLIERMLDEAAKELKIDPVELRRRNLVQPEAMPYLTPTGALHDGGDYPAAMQQALEMLDYEGFRKKQEEARARGRYLGFGIALGIEASPSNTSIGQLITPDSTSVGDSEAALVRIELNGDVTAALGTVPQGHGHETVVAQIVADELGLTPNDVTVTTGYDCQRDPSTPYSGTHASRFAVMGVGAVVGAARKLRKKLFSLVAHLVGDDPSALKMEGGKIIHGASGTAFTLPQLAKVANYELDRLPDGMEPSLEGRFVYHPPFGAPGPDGVCNFSITYAYGITIVTVEVDVETGRVKLGRIISVNDCGRRLNPMLLEGQHHGAIAHQLGAALFEAIKYDENGQLLTSNFKSYLTATAADLPSYEMGHFETPSLFSPLGARGGGEGGGTPLIATIAAVNDALDPFGIYLSEGHITPGELRAIIRKAMAAR